MYGADLAAWILVMLLRTKSGKTYNIGSQSGHSLLDVAWMVASHVEPVLDVVTNALMTGSIPTTSLVPDVATAKRDFGLEQFTSLDLSIERTLAWYKLQVSS